MWLLLLFCKYQFSPFYISVDSNIAIYSDVWAWEKYYKQPEVLSRIDVELLPTEPPAVISQDIEANQFTPFDSQLLCQPLPEPNNNNISRYWSQPTHITWPQLPRQPLPEPQNGAPIDELEDQPGIFERKDLLTKVLLKYFGGNEHKYILHRL